MKIRIKDWSQVTIVLVSVALLVTNGVLLYQNQQLRSSLDKAKQFVPDVGYKFSDINATSLSGEVSPISFSREDKKTMLFIFNTNCLYCVQQYPYWKTLISSLDRSKWDLFAITSQSEAELISKHLQDNGLSDLDVRIVPKEEVVKNRIGYTPMTIVVDSAGMTRKVLPGLWTKDFGVMD